LLAGEHLKIEPGEYLRHMRRVVEGRMMTLVKKGGEWRERLRETPRSAGRPLPGAKRQEKVALRLGRLEKDLLLAKD
jgi:hypothetical protein